MTLVPLFYWSLAGGKRLHDAIYGRDLTPDELWRKKRDKKGDVRNIGLKAKDKIALLKGNLASYPVVVNK